jgi:hypothetical protein
MLLVAQLGGDPFWAIYDIASISLRQSLVPDRLLARVSSTMHIADGGLNPIGALVAGILAEAIGVRDTIWLAVLGTTLGTGWLLFSPIPRLREAPVAMEG